MNFLHIGQQITKWRCAFVLFCAALSFNGSLVPYRVSHPMVVSSTITGFHLMGRYILDANGNNFVIRGINVPHNWYPDETSSSFQNIKAKGANTVRVVLSSGQSWAKNSASDVANVISWCKANKLICILEVHDTTGYVEDPSDPSTASLAQAVSYWKEIKNVLVGQESYVIINIGNEPYGNDNTAHWVNATKDAIADMRSSGFQHMLMVDGPDWGQDWEWIMSDNAASIFNSDPLRNTVFSIHMYEVFDTASQVQNYVSTFVNAGLPLVIGEFGPVNDGPGADVDAVMATAQSNGIGYLGWEWSGDGDPQLDMVSNFNPNQETSWGTRIIHGADGILQTSCEASIYGTSCFQDVPVNYWAASFIQRLYNSGITSGCNSAPLMYCPEATVTRAQMAVFLLRGIHGPSYSPPDVAGNTGFEDVASNYWAAAWIKELANEGITSGCGNSNYCPEDAVTRDQMALFLLRSEHGASYSPPDIGSGTGFGDVASNYWASAWIKELAAEGITGGCGSGNYCPATPVSRAQMAIFLVKTFNLP